MADDLLSVLTRFHRDVVLPDIERIVGSKVESSEQRILDRVLTLFDGIYQQLDRLEAEYHSLAGAVARIERRLGSPDPRVEKESIQEQVRELRTRLASLEERLADLEHSS